MSQTSPLSINYVLLSVACRLWITGYYVIACIWCVCCVCVLSASTGEVSAFGRPLPVLEEEEEEKKKPRRRKPKD